jgi:hypothetical protein
MKYKVIVQETVCVTYDEVEVEAADEEAAERSPRRCGYRTSSANRPSRRGDRLRRFRG